MKGSQMLALLSISLFTAAAPASAPAQTSADLAQDIVRTVFSMSHNRDAFVNNYVKSFTEGFEKDPRAAPMLAAHPQLRAAAVAAARKGANEQFSLTVLPAFERLIASIYQANFSASELAELAAHYRTPQAQRVLASFSAPNAATEVPAAKSDPVIVRFMASRVGQKEMSLNGEIAQAMTSGMLQSIEKVNAAVLPLVQQAMRAAMLRTKRPG